MTVRDIYNLPVDETDGLDIDQVAYDLTTTHGEAVADEVMQNAAALIASSELTLQEVLERVMPGTNDF